jgi:hypothetical protein
MIRLKFELSDRGSIGGFLVAFTLSSSNILLINENQHLL